MKQFRVKESITNKDDELLVRYLEDITKIKMLSVEEEADLAYRAKRGDKPALDRLVTANLRFVVSVAKQYQNQGLDLMDLISEGNIGLAKAAGRFDETKGFKFISYAVWWIRQSILQSLAEHSRVVRLPLNQIGSLSRIMGMMTQLEQDLQRKPTEKEIAEALEIDEQAVVDALGISGKQVSIETPLSDDERESDTLLDVMANDKVKESDNIVVDESLHLEIIRSLDTLSEKEKNVILYYFGIGIKNPMTLEEIGDELDLTRERVRQIKEKGLRRLRHFTRNKHLKEYIK